MTAPNLIEFRPGSHASRRPPIPLIPARAGYEHLTVRERLEIPAAARREALIQRLEAVGELAPDAPLSFLVVTIHGLASLDDGEVGPRAVLAVARSLAGTVRATDLIGRFAGASFGLVLQGRGAHSASVLAARLTFQLNRLPELVPPLRVTVHAASGTGRTAMALPAAAGESVPEAG